MEGNDWVGEMVGEIELFLCTMERGFDFVCVLWRAFVVVVLDLFLIWAHVG